MIWILLGCSTVNGHGMCDEAPFVSYETYGKGFLEENCQGCHASTTNNRNGAPDDVVFDSRGDVLVNAELILETVTAESPTMPPEGGISDEERGMVNVWLKCWEEE